MPMMKYITRCRTCASIAQNNPKGANKMNMINPIPWLSILIQ